MAKITIDGREFEATPGEMVIAVADRAGITIPRFCYHSHLSIAANCRMCLVEVGAGPKTVPACATPIVEGMIVKTCSEKAKASQQVVMEFLLINHPLDCPICDQGGECELQDLAMAHGSAHSHFEEEKRVVPDKDIGPLIDTHMTRCIHCTRCVRFGEEIAGLREMGATGRGEHVEIGTFLEKSLQSNLSGNVIDLCPVGALVSKPFKFKARTWEMTQRPGIGAHDSLGASLSYHISQDKVARVVPQANAALNEVWLSDRDRFSYEGYQHTDRLLAPAIKIHGVWETVGWETALTAVLKTLPADPLTLGALLSPQLTVEEGYLLQKLLRGLGCPNIDHQVRALAPAMPVNGYYPTLGTAWDTLEEADALVFIGMDVSKEQPLLVPRLRRAVARGATVYLLNPMETTQPFDVVLHSGIDICATLSALQASGVVTGKVHIVLGAIALQHLHAPQIQSAAVVWADALQATVGVLSEGPNSAGLWIAGAVPQVGPAGQPVTPGLTAISMLQQPRHVYWLFGLDPALDTALAGRALAAFQKAATVVSFTAYANDTLRQVADILLPIALPTENTGTYVNALGAWQAWSAAVPLPAEAKPLWKILRALSQLAGISDVAFDRPEAVRQEIFGAWCNVTGPTERVQETPVSHPFPTGLIRIGTVPQYAGDSIVRRAKALQATPGVAMAHHALMHPHTIAQHGLLIGHLIRVRLMTGPWVSLPLVSDAAVPKGAISIALGLEQTAALGPLYHMVEVAPA